MKNIVKLFTVLALSTVAFASCIQEAFPEGGTATKEQIGESASALEASVNGVPSQMSLGYLVYGDQVHETDMGYPQLMIAFTEMLGDLYPLGSNTGYDWYRNYNTSVSFGPTTYFAYLPWFTLYQFVKSANDIISAVDIENPDTPAQLLAYAGQAYAARAFDYYNLMVMWEPVENIYTDVSKVKGLTVPFVTEETTGEIAKNNPRATHAEMVEFILSDLDKAEKCFEAYSPSNKLFPTLPVVYAIKARVYMWDGGVGGNTAAYAKAAEYARKAINASGTPVTKEQWLDLTTGFNKANQAWMWYIHYDPENMRNLANFTGWMSGEADWGYSSLTRPSIDASLYNKIADTDFRKYTFVDPAVDDYQFWKYQTIGDQDWRDAMLKPYLSLKFRCAGGNMMDYAEGAAVDVPVMRIEEMYITEAEAVGLSQGVEAGVTLLNNFMKTYRDENYSFATQKVETLQAECLLQKRIEFWGEGCAFYDAKRIKPGVMQNYEGTNAPEDIFKINCKGIKPNWNFCIPTTEIQANKALEGWNNPDPSGVVKGPSPVGQYAE